jgi:hypothetical protein
LRRNIELALLISLKMDALLENIDLMSAIVLAEFVLDEFASNLLIAATIRFRSACKSTLPNEGVTLICAITTDKSDKATFRPSNDLLFCPAIADPPTVRVATRIVVWIRNSMFELLLGLLHVVVRDQ